MQNAINVHSAPLPFSNVRKSSLAPLGASVLDIVNEQVPFNIRKYTAVVVTINGDVILDTDWHRVRPKLGTIVNIKVVPTGGGGGKNPLAAILSIAVMVAAPYIGAMYGTTLGLSVMGNGVLTAGQTTFFNSIVAAGFSIVGRMAINALVPPPKPTRAVTNPSESPTMFIEGARNSLNPYGVVPVNLGKNRMFPLQCAKPYTETNGDDQYSRQLFTWGFGNAVRITDLKLGDTPLTNFTDFEIEHVLDGTLHQGTTIYSNRVSQNNQNVLLEEVDGFTTRSFPPNADEGIVDITFPQGLCQFASNGKRQSRTVEVEVQFSEVGSGVWSVGNSYKSVDASNISFSVPAALGVTTFHVYININSGQVSTYNSPQNNRDFIYLSEVVISRTKPVFSPIVQTLTVKDRRPSGVFGVNIENAGDFLPTYVSPSVINIAAGGIRSTFTNFTASTAEAVRRSIRFVFPTKGDYEVRVRRVTPDTTDEKIIDKVFLSAVKTVEYVNPVNLSGLCGAALYIRGTDQMNGVVEELNGIVETAIPDYIADSEEWIENFTSNPASIYRYVLQGQCNAKPLPDDQIDISALEDWHTYCAENGYTYNRVIDYDASVDDILRDVAAAGCATPAVVDGKRSIVIDRAKDDIVQIVTPRNSWNYSGEMLYPEMPHAFRVQFRNADKGYLMDERIVYDDGYNASNATLFEQLEFHSCTNAQLAWKMGRRFLATARLRPESHSFMMDFENLVAMRGDRIKLEHDIPLIGVGDARIKEVMIDSGGFVTGLIVDDEMALPMGGQFYTRIRLSDGTQLYKQLSNVGNTTTYQLDFLTPFDDFVPEVGDLLYVTVSGGELDLIITKIEPQNDLTAKITCLNYAPEIFTAESGTIPSFNSNITVPLSMQRPLSPVLVEFQSDENVALLNLDGSFTSRAVITLTNRNENNVLVDVRIRKSGDNVWANANVLEATPERLILTGLDDGYRYDIWIRYKRGGGDGLYSAPLQLNSVLFVGLSGPPDDVTGFVVSVSENTSFFEWNANDDIDISHYEIRYNGVFSGAVWETAQVFKAPVYENRLSAPFIPGTYLIKAVDLSGNYSVNATAIITYDPGILRNAVAILREDPDFDGVMDNTVNNGGLLQINDVAAGSGYYYFEHDLDLQDVYTSFVSATINAYGDFKSDLYTEDDLYSMGDMFGVVNSNDLYTEDDLYSIDDMFGLALSDWSVRIEYRTTNDDPTSSFADWTDWAVFEASDLTFRAIQFRVLLQSFRDGITPSIDRLSITIDMPDRIERGEDLTVPVTGLVINYTPPFLDVPATAITIQDGDAADEIEYVYKDADGFEVKIFNRVDMSYVERIIDFISSGYGRKLNG